jgi:hypothetical protein
MARHPHGASSDAWVFTIAGDGVTPQLLGGSDVTCWSDQTGGTQYTDLLDGDGVTPITSVTTSAGGVGVYTIGQIPLFYGPDSISGMWISADLGPRVWLPSNDLDARVTANEDEVANNGNRLDALEDLSLITVLFTNNDGSGWPVGGRPAIAGDRFMLWPGPTPPGIGGTPEFMRDNLDMFLDRTP